MKMNKAYRFRIYPNTEQSVLFAKTFGCARAVYNFLLGEKIAYYEENGKMLYNTPAHLKEQFEWLKEVDSLALSNAQLDLQQAFKNFFTQKNVGFPKFKSKHHCAKSYTTNMVNDNIRIEGGKLRLPKVGIVRIKMHRQIPEGCKIKSVTVTQEPSGKYYASILVECETEISEIELHEELALGLDYSSPHFYVDSNGESADMPHWYRNTEKKLAKEQRKLSKMQKCSSNWYKQKKKVARAYEKVRHQRADWQHKKSKELAEQYDIICVEDIHMQGMAQSLKLGKATNDNAFGQFRTFLWYKLAERGKKLITITKWFPSSKTCRFCGTVNAELSLKDRVWTCDCCNATLDRDVNAAINIRNQGLSMLA